MHNCSRCWPIIWSHWPICDVCHKSDDCWDECKICNIFICEDCEIFVGGEEHPSIRFGHECPVCHTVYDIQWQKEFVNVLKKGEWSVVMTDVVRDKIGEAPQDVQEEIEKLFSQLE